MSPVHRLIFAGILVTAMGAPAYTVRRSFRNGYPEGMAVTSPFATTGVSKEKQQTRTTKTIVHRTARVFRNPQSDFTVKAECGEPVLIDLREEDASKLRWSAVFNPAVGSALFQREPPGNDTREGRRAKEGFVRVDIRRRIANPATIEFQLRCPDQPKRTPPEKILRVRLVAP